MLILTEWLIKAITDKSKIIEITFQSQRVHSWERIFKPVEATQDVPGWGLSRNRT
jgi:hypothetical protein